MQSSSDILPKVTASFRVMGAHLDPKAVSGMLHLDPDYSHCRGDSRIRKGRRYADYSEGLWSIESDALATAPIEAHIDNLLGKLTGRKEAIQELKLGNLRVDIFIGVFRTGGTLGFSLSDKAIELAAELGLSIGFDLYTANP
jgi:hypothetical protein